MAVPAIIGVTNVADPLTPNRIPWMTRRMTDILTKATLLLTKHEGMSLKPYHDSTGHLSIGIGRSLDTRGITEAEARHLLANDIVYFSRELHRALPWYNQLDDTRKLALLDMAFNLGIVGLLQFKKMLKAMQQKRWTLAATEALDSKWRLQVGQRAATIANMIQTGQMPSWIA